jgi:hypothetical protein
MCVYIVGVEEEDESCSCASANHRCGRLKVKVQSLAKPASPSSTLLKSYPALLNKPLALAHTEHS